MLLFLTLHLMCFEEERLLGGLSRHCFRLQTIVFKFSGFIVLLVVFIQDCHHGPWNGDFPWLLLVLPLANSIGNKNKKKKQKNYQAGQFGVRTFNPKVNLPKDSLLDLNSIHQMCIVIFQAWKKE